MYKKLVTFAMTSKRYKIKAEAFFDGKADSYIQVLFSFLATAFETLNMLYKVIVFTQCQDCYFFYMTSLEKQSALKVQVGI